MALIMQIFICNIKGAFNFLVKAYNLPDRMARPKTCNELTRLKNQTI